ncbi:RING finger and transmembrane domain-containing protein 2 [Toxocara canis]|uniref:RING finger and transmembrane domain-containing protein 2 n=1 Tax=Toxocara canis TaxID=6265 RepID=A0A0B2VJC8_TOXCA|nr:RING finger and transmembrane domain-containing protein 2 [Toxocara canis]
MSYLTIVFSPKNFSIDDVFLPLIFMSPTPTPPTFFSTLHAVLLVDFSVRLLTIQLKTIVAFIPPVILSNKRRRHRIYQWLEYTSQLYRYFLPVPRWYRYFGYSQSSNAAVYYSSTAFIVLYVIHKVLMSRLPLIRWLHSTRFVCCLSSIGSVPSRAELAHFPQCTICFSEVADPIKLPCGHVFCHRCIGTWLDNENTCPNCRAVVSFEDNSWKNGSTSYLPQFC